MSTLPLLAAIGLLLGAWCFVKCFARWDFALHALIVIVFFGGIIGVRLGSGAYPIMFRDAFAVLPLYLGFFSRRTGQLAAAQMPIDLLGIIAFLLVSLLLSLFNPADTSFMQILIGAKVWLYYIPFLAIGLALAADEERLFAFLRQALFWGLAACGIGLVQSLLVRIVGFETVIGWFFGSHADAVTQGFGHFDVVGGIYRIPGTFSFAAQYAAFLHFYLAVTMVEANADPDGKIRKVAQIALFVCVVAGILCGAREMIVVVPATLLSYVLCGLLTSRILLVAPVGAFIGFLALRLSGVDLVGYFFIGRELAVEYGQDWIWDQINRGLEYGFLGAGIGSSTGSARYAADGVAGGFSDAVVGLGFESYFGKAAAELGWLGFAAIVLLMTAIAIRALASILSSWAWRKRAIVAPFAIYLLYNVIMSFKGYVLDTDPGDMTIWLALGLVIGLARRRVDRSEDAAVSLDEYLSPAMDAAHSWQRAPSLPRE